MDVKPKKIDRHCDFASTGVSNRMLWNYYNVLGKYQVEAFLRLSNAVYYLCILFYVFFE